MLSGRFAQWMEALALAMIVMGIVALCQPWSFALFQHGFKALFAGVLLFVLFSHRRPVR